MIYTTLPIKYLLNTVFMLHTSIMPLRDSEMKIEEAYEDKEKHEMLKIMDVLLERTKEINFRQKVKLKLRGVSVKFSMLPKGKSLGSSFVKLKVNGCRIAYITDFSLKSEIHVNPLKKDNLINDTYEIVISKLASAPSSHVEKDHRNKLKSRIERVVEDYHRSARNTTVFVINNVSRIFEYLLVINGIIKSNEIRLKVMLPGVYKYYIDVLKGLSEYMSFSISQNFDFDYYIFDFNFLQFIKKNAKGIHNSPKIVIASEFDLIYGDIIDNLDLEENEQLKLFFLDDDVNNVIGKENFSQLEENNKKYMKTLNSSNNTVLEEETNQFNDTVLPDVTINDEMQIEEEVIEKSSQSIAGDDFKYFELKQDFFEFKFDLEVPYQTDYGYSLTNQELKDLQLANPKEENEEDIADIVVEKETHKDERIYMGFINFFKGNKERNTHRLNKAEMEFLSMSCLADLRDQIFLFSKLQIRRLVFINEVAGLEDIKTKLSHVRKISTLEDGSGEVYVTKKEIGMQISSQNLDSLKLEPIRDKLAFANVKVTVKPESDIPELVLSNKYYEDRVVLLKEKSLIKVYQFCKKQKIDVKLNFGSLIFNDRIFLYKESNRFVFEGPIGPDYFRIRKEIYSFIKNKEGNRRAFN